MKFEFYVKIVFCMEFKFHAPSKNANVAKVRSSRALLRMNLTKHELAQEDKDNLRRSRTIRCATRRCGARPPPSSKISLAKERENKWLKKSKNKWTKKRKSPPGKKREKETRTSTTPSTHPWSTQMWWKYGRYAAVFLCVDKFVIFGWLNEKCGRYAAVIVRFILKVGCISITNSLRHSDKVDWNRNCYVCKWLDERCERCAAVAYIILFGWVYEFVIFALFGWLSEKRGRCAAVILIFIHFIWMPQWVRDIRMTRSKVWETRSCDFIWLYSTKDYFWESTVVEILKSNSWLNSIKWITAACLSRF